MQFKKRKPFDFTCSSKRDINGNSEMENNIGITFEV